MVFAEHFPCIVSSISIDGCMERGLDATWGGANYNSTGLTCLGTANVADSLMAIKKYCFDTHRCSLKDMYNALLSNWEGYEELRYNIISHCPHYGNNDPEVDELASWALSVFADHMNAATGPRGYYRGGTFTMTTHLAYGSITGATADGRKSGEPLAEAISPRQGFDKNGPTSYLSSAAKLPHIDLCNGDQLNIRFSQSSVNSFADLIKLKSAIRSYFSLGGMQVQFNIVSTETLKDAQKHPEEHSSLIVRIAGYSAYFTQLTRDMQDDFISRTEQSL